MKQDYITTYSKHHISVTDPLPEDILIEDIAHALSYLSRANGHMKQFYSVALHSINCAREAKARGFSVRVQLAALLHDASEAYLADISRPLKRHLPGYLVYENKLQNIIFKKYGLSDLTRKEMKQKQLADDVLLYYEFLVLMGERLPSEDPRILSEPDFSEKSFKEVEHMFLEMFHELKQKTQIKP